MDPKIINALRSQDYRAILKIIGAKGRLDGFKKSDISSELPDRQNKKLNNFLQRMKKLNALRSGEAVGDYVYTNTMVAIYIWLESTKN